MAVIHRDLKPDNILIDSQFNLKLTDFGESEKLEESADQVDSPSTETEDIVQGRSGEQRHFVGTPLYAAPEMFNDSQGSTAIDIWALGVIIYQMHVGKTPFFGRSLGDIYLEVQSMQIEYPASLAEEVVDLIQNLLHIDPAQRLGTGKTDATSFSKLKSHPYFRNLDFTKLDAQPDIAPYFANKQTTSTARRMRTAEDDATELSLGVLELQRRNSPLDLENEVEESKLPQQAAQIYEEEDSRPNLVLSGDRLQVKNYCTALAEMLVGRFAKMETEYVSEHMVLCTRMDTHDNVPVTVTKAKVPFLTVQLYKQFLESFHQQYPLFDSSVAITQLPSFENNRLKCWHWDISMNSRLQRNRSLLTLTY